jgi:phage shock protein B
MNMELIALIVLGALLVLCIPILLIVLVFKILYKLLSSQDNSASGEETRILQEINTKLGRLEKRIESLESIVVSTDNPRL